MKNQATVKIQCKNRILLKAIFELLEQTPKIQIVQNLPDQNLAELDHIEFIVREEDELLKQWESSLDPNGRIHMYIHPSENCITLTTRSRIELNDVAELADLIVYHQEKCFQDKYSEENHNQAAPDSPDLPPDLGKDVEK